MLATMKFAGILVASASLVAGATIGDRAVPLKLYYFSFGDSYTTTGFNINGVQPSPSDPLGNPPLGTAASSTQAGTFAGGINYVGWLATKYNSTLVQAYDFGVGGACINDTSQGCHANIPDYYQQVTSYFEPKYTAAATKFWRSNNAIFSIFFGINDIGLPLTTSGASPGNISTRVPAMLDQYFNTTDILYAAGARRFMFVGIPPLDRSPLIQSYGASLAATYSNWVNTFNGQLASRITSWTKMRTGAVSATYDYHRWMEGVLDQPVSYGFPNATCVNGNGQECIWWNNYHVGARFDDLLAARMKSAMDSLGYNGSVPTGGYFY